MDVSSGNTRHNSNDDLSGPIFEVNVIKPVNLTVKIIAMDFFYDDLGEVERVRVFAERNLRRGHR